ncbi:MAG: calcium-translocating P-type ATPase, PMCA-type [Alistipes sp.]|nr:calcium-translocating P-type ATPase, PMCA-type [Alistipes sp.]
MYKRSNSSFRDICQDANGKAVAEGKGMNIIPPPERESLWWAYLEKFKDPIIIVLMVAFVLSLGLSLYEVFVMGDELAVLFEPIGVLLALLLATGVGFIFEVKAGREFDILNKVKDSRPVKVLRLDSEGCVKMYLVEKQNVVKGDIVRLEPGDEIPADGTLIEALGLRVDESNFTGEPYVNKYTNPDDFDKDATYPSDFALRGSTIIEGSGVMQVTAIGMDTEEGHGVARAAEGSDVQTPLNKQLEQLGGWISRASFIIATLIIVGRMLIFWLSGGFETSLSWVELLQFILASVMIAVTLIVVAVPEGLPMSVTVSLAMSMRRMLKENSLVRKLHACETMGAATVICTDKTGTLTKNRMTVMEVEMSDATLLGDIINCMAVNSTAELTVENGKVSPIGNPTEGALLMWLQQQGVDYAAVRERYNVVSQVPFSTETKSMMTEVREVNGERYIRYIKGAPEVVMAMCEDCNVAHYEGVLRGYQSRAMRTLGFAVEEGGVTRFLGVVGISDPIREDVAEAINTCMNSAGVRVIIVTGDTPGTALEIGRQIGLITSDEGGQIISGPDFAALSDDEARELLKGDRLKIISRARPDDKARLVMLLQDNNEVVAVTGDGTNDAPALSKAQVGLSMGDGTSRAKEASDITIIDNSFASINKAIMWGRSLYLNIRRFIIFQMTINLCACLIVLFGAFIGYDSPLTVTQMLWVNLIMDTFAAMALSSLPPDRCVLNERPRDPRSHIIDRKMLWRIVSMGLAFFAILAILWQYMHYVDIASVSEMISMECVNEFVGGSRGVSTMTGVEMGIYFSIFVLMQFWNLFNVKYFRTNRSLIGDIVDLVRNPEAVKESYNKYFLLIAAVILVGQVVIVTFAGEIFNVEPISFKDWLLIIAITSPVMLIPDIVRFIRK